MQKINIAVFALGLAVCANGIAQQGARPTAADDPSNACFDAIGSNPDMQVLIPKIGYLSGPRAKRRFFCIATMQIQAMAGSAS